jgi:DNA gyrase subunit A
VLTACVNGYGKRTPLEDYPVKGRGTRGVINIDANERNGDVVGMNLVVASDELMLITEKGILIRTRVDEIRETGRNAAGVRLIKVDDGDRLVAMAKIDAEEKVVDDAAAAAAGEETGASPTTGEQTETGAPRSESDGANTSDEDGKDADTAE